jgi:hypothetical protein
LRFLIFLKSEGGIGVARYRSARVMAFAIIVNKGDFAVKKPKNDKREVINR